MSALPGRRVSKSLRLRRMPSPAVQRWISHLVARHIAAVRFTTVPDGVNLDFDAPERRIEAVRIGLHATCVGLGLIDDARRIEDIFAEPRRRPR